jgi:hypothetical protein
VGGRGRRPGDRVGGSGPYLGYAKPIVATGFPTPYLFGVAWLGLSAVASAVSLTLLSAGLEFLGLLLGLVAIGCFALTLVSFCWLPRSLQPAWFRGWVDRGRRIEELREWPTWGRGDRRA